MTKIDYFTEERSTETVNARMGDDINPRLREVMASLIKHLHGFVKDVELTQDEWEAAIDFLTRTGHDEATANVNEPLRSDDNVHRKISEIRRNIINQLKIVANTNQ